MTHPLRSVALLPLLPLLSGLPLRSTLPDAVAGYPARMAGNGVAQPTCPVSMQMALVCYQPSQVKQAERLLPVRPLDPSKAVARITGLPLTLVIAGTRRLPTPSKGVIWLNFAYGDVPFDQSTQPQPAIPAWMTVGEVLGHVKGLQGMRLWRDEINGQKGTWQLWANLPRHKLNVQVVTNQSRTVIRAVGKELIREAEKTAGRTYTYLAPARKRFLPAALRLPTPSLR